MSFMRDDMIHEKFMREALAEARIAADMGEVPVGAVVVRDGEVIARAHNLCETEKNATLHAEMLAISEACRKLGGWRLSDCTLYVTLEPCPMCAGAVINSRVMRVVYGAKDARAGAFGSILALQNYPMAQKPEIICGVLHDECLAVLKDFFAKKRSKPDSLQVPK